MTLEDAANSGYSSATLRAFIWIGLGDRERPISLLRKSFDDRSIGALMLRTDFHFDALRSGARFQVLLRQAGFDR